MFRWDCGSLVERQRRFALWSADHSYNSLKNRRFSSVANFALQSDNLGSRTTEEIPALIELGLTCGRHAFPAKGEISPAQSVHEKA